MSSSGPGGSSRGGVSRVEKKLQASIENKNYYEAHQMYRTLYSRYVAQNKHKEVQDLMISGAFLFFEANEDGSAVDLSLLFLESLENSKTPVSDELIDTIGKIHSNIDKGHPQLNNFEVKAITWSTLSDGVPKTGHSKLRHTFALNLWKEKSYGEARQHFLYSGDGDSSGEMLVEFSMSSGLKEEDDLFITQFVLQLLCVREKQTASAAFSVYTQKHPRCGKGPPFSLPLLNFLCFLLATVESQKLTWFTVLCDQYKISLDRDPAYFQYLEKIGENFFNIKLPKKPKGPKGFFGNIINSLMSESDDLDSGAMEVDPLFNGLENRVERKDPGPAMTEEELD